MARFLKSQDSPGVSTREPQLLSLALARIFPLGSRLFQHRFRGTTSCSCLRSLAEWFACSRNRACTPTTRHDYTIEFVRPSGFLSIYLSSALSVGRSVGLSVCLSVCPCAHLFFSCESAAACTHVCWLLRRWQRCNLCSLQLCAFISLPRLHDLCASLSLSLSSLYLPSLAVSIAAAAAFG